LLCVIAGVLSTPTLLTTPRVVGRKRFVFAWHAPSMPGVDASRAQDDKTNFDCEISLSKEADGISIFALQCIPKTEEVWNREDSEEQLSWQMQNAIGFKKHMKKVNRGIVGVPI